MKSLWFTCVTAFGIFVLLVSSVHASDRVCKSWYQKRQYVEASRCFYSMAQSLMKNKLSTEQRESVGIWLRNAILSLRKAAEQEKSAESAAHLREQAIHYLDEYLQKKLYDSDTQKRSAEIQRTGLLEQVGYTQLTITSQPNALIQVTGFRFDTQKTGAWSQSVRPGNYTILVKYANGLTKARIIRIFPRQPQVVDMMGEATTSPPPVRRITTTVPPPSTPRKVPIASWVMFGVGGATAIASAVLFGVGMSDQIKGDNLYDTKVKLLTNNADPKDTQELIRLQNESNRNLAIAWVGAGITVVAVTIGVILYAVQSPAPATAPPSSAPPTATPSQHNTSIFFRSP